jgi:hypothetical protein
LVLNEAYDLWEIVCKSEAALNRAINAFLEMPSEGAYSLKNYPFETDARVAYIKKLEKFARTQGSNVTAVYKPPTQRILGNAEFLREFVPEYTC